jgi:pilus assembly protein CpaF
MLGAMSEINFLQKYLADSTVTDVLFDGGNSTLIERSGNLENAECLFSSEEELVSWVKSVFSKNNSRVDIAKPISEVSIDSEFGPLRIHAVLAGECSKVTRVSIRRHNTKAMSLQDLGESQTLNAEQLTFLQQIILQRENFVIIGGTGSGKTTLLRAMLNEVSLERIITIEDSPELNLFGNSVQLTTRPGNHEGVGEITLNRLLREALRMRPDRLVIGEARGEELLLLLQAMNTGHTGSGFTLHANSVDDAIPRMLAILAGVGLSPELGRTLIASSITWVVEVRKSTGLRQLSSIQRLQAANV